MPVNFQWFGEGVKREVQTVVAEAVNSSADDILKDAKKNCPVEKYKSTAKSDYRQYQSRNPGSLKKSGRIVRWRKKNVVGAFIRFGGRGFMVNGIDTYYAPFVELGTPGTMTRMGDKRVAIKATPFLRNALKKNKRKLLKIKKL